jgi:hypothetical protein
MLGPEMGKPLSMDLREHASATVDAVMSRRAAAWLRRRVLAWRLSQRKMDQRRGEVFPSLGM